MKKTIFILLISLSLILSGCASQTLINQTASDQGLLHSDQGSNTAPAAGDSQSASVPSDNSQKQGGSPAAGQVAAPAGQDASAAPAELAVQATASGVRLDTSYENAVSVPQQLLLGTLKLKDTDLAVTQEQAIVLLPLWTSYKTLTASMGVGQGGPGQGGPGQQPDQSAAATPQAVPTVDAETQTQMGELVEQIQAAMTSDQITAIAALQITQQTVMTITQELGITMGGPQGGGNGGGQPPAGMTPPDGGQMPQGTPPSGGGMTPPGGQQGGQPGGPQGGGGMLPPGLIDALIELLTQVSGSASTSTGTSSQIAFTPGDAPSGTPGGASGGASGGAQGASSGTYTITAFYSQDGGSETQAGQSYNAAETDESAVYVTNAGALTLSDATITTSGNTSSFDNSSFHGLNAAVLAASGSSITISNSSITTSGTGANGAFATDAGSTVSLSNVIINATADGGHGVMATNGGSLTLTNVNMTTSGKNSGAIATDRGSGTIDVTGGIVTTSGQDSPAIYSTGVISIMGGTLTATGSEAAVIEGANNIALTDCSLSSSKEKWGVMIYQSMSGDAEGARGVFSMTGGSLTYSPTNGPLFYVTNSTGVITLVGVNVASASETLVKASVGSWGSAGSNGGTVLFTAEGQTLKGNLTADNLSSIALTLQNGSTLTGAFNAEHTARAASLALDATSIWNVTADSYLTSLENSSGISGTTITNITGNGHTVYYDASACPALGGQTYTLTGGGYLTPAS